MQTSRCCLCGPFSFPSSSYPTWVNTSAFTLQPLSSTDPAPRSLLLWPMMRSSEKPSDFSKNGWVLHAFLHMLNLLLSRDLPKWFCGSYAMANKVEDFYSLALTLTVLHVCLIWEVHICAESARCRPPRPASHPTLTPVCFHFPWSSSPSSVQWMKAEKWSLSTLLLMERCGLWTQTCREESNRAGFPRNYYKIPVTFEFIFEKLAYQSKQEKKSGLSLRLTKTCLIKSVALVESMCLQGNR